MPADGIDRARLAESDLAALEFSQRAAVVSSAGAEPKWPRSHLEAGSDFTQVTDLDRGLARVSSWIPAEASHDDDEPRTTIQAITAAWQILNKLKDDPKRDVGHSRLRGISISPDGDVEIEFTSDWIVDVMYTVDRKGTVQRLVFVDGRIAIQDVNWMRPL